VLAAVALILAPGAPRWYLAVMLGGGAGLVASGARAARSGRVPYDPGSPQRIDLPDAVLAASWGVVDRIPFAHVEIEHVAFGPHGVVAVETTYLGWPGPVTERDLDLLDETRRRVKRAARRLRLLLKAEGVDAAVTPALALWGGGIRYIQPGLFEGVLVLVGAHPEEWRDQLPSSGELLPPETLTRIEGVLRRSADAWRATPEPDPSLIA
jgi:hypothetical protein